MAYIHVGRYFGEPQPVADASSCKPYGPGEIAKSKTFKGHLSTDVIEDPKGNLLVADMGVTWRSVNDSVKAEPQLTQLKDRLNTLMNTAVSDSTAKIRILGYSDCIGEEKDNIVLRRGRAKKFLEFLREIFGKDPRWTTFRSRIVFAGEAPVGEYVADNVTVDGRAKNRGVVVELTRTFSYPGETPPVRSCKQQMSDKVADLLKRANTLFDPDQAQRLVAIFQKLSSGDDRYLLPSTIFDHVRGRGALTWQHLGNFSDELCNIQGQRAKALSDAELAQQLRKVDELVIAGLRQINIELTQVQRSRDPLLVYRKSTVNGVGRVLDDLKNNPQSIYHAYRNVTP